MQIIQYLFKQFKNRCHFSAPFLVHIYWTQFSCLKHKKCFTSEVYSFRPS